MTHARAFEEEQHDATDDTVVVTAAGATAADVVGDETVVVTANDETIVAHASDETVVVMAAAEVSTSDETVVVATPSSDETVVTPVSDATVVSPTPALARRRDRRLGSQQQVPSAGDPAPPVVAATDSRVSSHGVAVSGGFSAGLDLERPIAPVPGGMPWEYQPTGERGLAQGLPVSYGARVSTGIPLHTGADEVQRQIGAAPQATPVYVAQGRFELPSLEKKNRRRKLATLVLYGCVTVATAFGLFGVAAIAFGW